MRDRGQRGWNFKCGDGCGCKDGNKLCRMDTSGQMYAAKCLLQGCTVATRSIKYRTEFLLNSPKESKEDHVHGRS